MSVSIDSAQAPADARTIAQILDNARERLTRLHPVEANLAVQRGAVLVDIRPVHQRQEEGEIPGALPIERNVLE